MLLALAAGGLTAYWFVGRRGQSQLPVGSRAVPADALMTLTFSTDEAQWEQLRRFGTRETQTQLNQYIATWRDRLLTDLDLSYEQDVAPWVGEAITVAFLASGGASPLPELERPLSESPGSNPFDPDQMNLEGRPVAWFLPIDPSVTAQVALARLESAGVSAQQEYQGLEIYQIEGGDQSYWATVLDRRMLAIATSSTDVEAIIDAYENDTSVLNVPGYRQAAQRVSRVQPFLQAYINSDAATAAAAANATEGAPSLVPLRKDGQGIAATASLTETGIEVDSVTWLKPDANQTFTGSPVEDVASFLPLDTVLVMAGGNLQRLWRSQQETQTTGFLNPDNIRGTVDALTGLSVDEDLIPWMGDEYALALVAPTASVDGPMGLVLQLKTSDRSAAEDALDRLDQSVRSRHNFQIAQNVVDGVPLVQWTSPLAALQVTRQWVNKDRVSIRVGASEAPPPESSLGQSELFTGAVDDSSSPNGFFFVNPQRLAALDRGLPLPSFPPALQSAAEAIQAIGLKTTIPSDQTLQFNISVLLDQLSDPGQLPAPGAEPLSPRSPNLGPSDEEEPSDGFIAPPQ